MPPSQREPLEAPYKAASALLRCLADSDATRLEPNLTHRWMGETTPLRMVIDSDVVLKAPIALSLAGADQRALMLEKQQWWWDPRPWLIATRPVRPPVHLERRP